MLRWFVVVALACAFVAAGSTDGGAHGDEGLIEVEAVQGKEPQSVEVRARLVYANDREPVSNASVMLQGVSPSGAALPAQLLASEGDGIYAGAVILPEPGQWKLQVMSVVPSALVDLEFDAAATTTTTTTLPRSDNGQVPRSSGATVDDDGDGFLPAALIAAGVILGGGIAAFFVQRRRRTGS